MRLSGESVIDLRNMKPRKLFTKLFPSYFLISFIGLFVLIIITRYTFSNFYFEETKTALIEKSRLIEDEVLSLTVNERFDLLRKRIKKFSELSDNRITVILPSGVVIADTSFNPTDMADHAEREEILTALKGEIGQASRYSPTLGENFVYVALPLKKNGNIVGVLRSAVTKSKLENSLASLTNKTLVWSFGLLIFLTYFIYVQARKISLPLEKIKLQVESFAKGDFSKSLELDSTQITEINSFSQSMGFMSEKIQAQFEKITKQKNEQLAVFSSMLEGVITISSDMTIYHINDSALKLFHAESVIPIRGVELIDIVKNDTIVRLARKLLEEDVSFQAEVETENGSILQVHGTILNTQKSLKLGAVLVFNDVTKLKELELHRTEFVANVSHELKTPLTSIQGYLETLQGDVIKDPILVEKFVSIVNKHAIRLKTIIEDLLSLSSIEKDSEVSEIKLETTSINLLFNTVGSLCQNKASLKNVSINIKDSNLEIKLNIALMEQAMINLVDNAISYSPDSGEVVISSRCDDSYYYLEVQDFGLGIASEHHERLFERFYSVDKARSRELGGSGLGLSIVKHIAKTHNGRVSVKSALGEGAIFSIILPRFLD